MSTSRRSGHGTPEPGRRQAVRHPREQAVRAAPPVRPRPLPPLYPGQPVRPGAGSSPQAAPPPRPRGAGHAAGSLAPSPGDTADAGALAAAFAADFLSWDETDPARRGRALAPYVAAAAREEQLAGAGWQGCGRQRAEIALPGTVVGLGTNPNRVAVHVRVRVTPFRRRTEGSADPCAAATSQDVLLFPAAAPAPAHPQWESLDSYWYELLIPLLEREERWRVDIGAVIVVPPLPCGDAGGGTDGRGS